MSDDRDESARAKSRNYRNPPPEHRFQKGQSGNPKGRPRKSPSPVHSVLVEVEGKAIFAVEDQIQTIALQEVYRPVRVREGDRSSQIPAIQAIIRRLVASAASGNVSAQKQIVTLAMQGEASRNAAKAREFDNALELQMRHRELLDQCEKNGLPPPDIVPHPDDIILNMETLEVKYLGPVTKVQRDALDDWHNRRPQIEDNLREAEEILSKNPKNAQARKLKRTLSKFLATIEDDEAHWKIRQARKKSSSPNANGNRTVSGTVDLRKDFGTSEIKDVTSRPISKE